MWDKIMAFFKGFFHNVTADPVSSAKGALQLATAAATAYGMSTGTIPVTPATVTATAAFAGAGVHALGTDSVTGKTSDAATTIESGLNAVQSIAAAAPSLEPVISIVKAAVEQKGQEASMAAKTQAVIDLTQALSAALTPAGSVKSE